MVVGHIQEIGREKKNETKTSDLNHLVFVRTSVVIRKQRKRQML